MTVALEAGEWSAACPDHTLPQERDGNPFTGGWVGPRTGLDGQKTLPHWDSIPDHADHNQSLYELSYPTHTHTHTHIYIYIYTGCFMTLGHNCRR